MKTPPHILGIDRGSKYIGLAYVRQNDTITMPIGYLMNDNLVFYTIGEFLVRYNICTVVVGYPAKQEDIQKKIDAFIANVSYIIDPEKTTIVKEEEDYTSVQAGEIVSMYRKNVAEDTVSAMVLLERWMQKQ